MDVYVQHGTLLDWASFEDLPMMQYWMAARASVHEKPLHVRLFDFPQVKSQFLLDGIVPGLAGSSLP